MLMMAMATTTLGALCMVYSSLSRNNSSELGSGWASIFMRQRYIFYECLIVCSVCITYTPRFVV